MTSSTLEIRTARLEELDALHTLMELAIGALLKPFLNEAEVASSRTIMGLHGGALWAANGAGGGAVMTMVMRIAAVREGRIG